MTSRRILAAAFLLCAVAPAHAQKTKAQLNNEISSQFPDNGNGAITPQILRNLSSDIVNSIMPTAPVVTGNLACFNGTTGLLQDCGSAPGAYLPLAGGTMSGPIAMGGNNISGFGAATGTSLAVTGALTSGVQSSASGQIILNWGGGVNFTTITNANNGGNPTLQTPNASGTIADNATAPILLNAGTGNISCPTCLIANQTITLSGDVTGSGATGISTTIANNAVTNAKAAQMAAASVKCNPTATTANAQDCPGAAWGFATLRPFPSQASGAANGWNAVDPLGNPISTSGTACQGLDNFLAAVKTNGWSWRIVGNATITCNTTLQFPPCFLKTELIDTGVTIAFTAQGSATLAKVDSHENCWHAFRNQWTQNSADTGVVLDYVPTSVDGAGNITFAANYHMEWGVVGPATGGTGVQYDATNGGFIGNKIWEGDVNGGTSQIRLINPGSGTIAVEDNEIHHGYIHGGLVKVIQWGTSTAFQSTIRRNNHFFGRLDPGAGSIAAFDDYGTDERFYGINIVNETANATTGLILESGACNNKFFGGTINATTPMTDSGGCAPGNGNAFIEVTNVPSTYARQMLALSYGTATLAQASAAFMVNIGSAGEGFVQATCPYSGLFRNLRINTSAVASGQTVTATWRVNNANTSITCIYTGTGAGGSCSDLTHTATCTAGQPYSLGLVTSATTGTINFISGGVEFDAP